jgi:protein-tyrosine-phosphatase
MTLAAWAPRRVRRRGGCCSSAPANSARSHLAAALWRQASRVPAASAGTRPVGAIDPGAVDAALRRQLPLPRRRPRHISGVQEDGDLVITVCDLAHEELGPLAALHWSVPDPVPAGFDAALDELGRRVRHLAPRLAPADPATGKAC